MAWLRIALTEDEQRIVRGERESHPDPCVRRRLWALWLLHCGPQLSAVRKRLTHGHVRYKVLTATLRAGCLYDPSIDGRSNWARGAVVSTAKYLAKTWGVHTDGQRDERSVGP